MRKSALQPRSRNTPRGGRKMARMILMMSLREVLAMVDKAELCVFRDFCRRRKFCVVWFRVLTFR